MSLLTIGHSLNYRNFLAVALKIPFHNEFTKKIHLKGLACQLNWGIDAIVHFLCSYGS